MKAYLDTEFHSFDHPRLLSVGLVTDDGRELYLELTERARPKSVSTFVGDTVLTQFGLVPGAEVDSVEELGRRLGEWLLGLKSDIEVIYDYSVDYELAFESALKRAGIWARLESRLAPTHVGYISEEEEAIQASEISWAASLAADGISQHHSLADARALRAAFHAVHSTKESGQFDASSLPNWATEISAEQVTWFERTIQRIADVMADKDDDRGAPDGAPILFLDIDDVVCLSKSHGGHDAVDAVRGRRIDSDDVFARLLNSPAVKVLQGVHTRLEGHVRYVVSSTWRQHLNRSELAEILRRSGAGFVADNLECRDRWATPDWSAENKSRLDEIAEWLRRHGQGEAFVVVDDTFSGGSLKCARDDAASPFFGRIVLCEQDVGLLPIHAEVIVRALKQSPANSAADALNEVRAGGQAQLRAWVCDGTLLPTVEFAHRRGWTTLGAHRARVRGDTFTIKVVHRHYHVAMLAQLPEPLMRTLVAELAPLDKAQRLLFLLRKHGTLEGKTVAEAVAAGSGERVLELARAWCAEEAGGHGSVGGAP